MKQKSETRGPESIEGLIHTVRAQKVILDADLAMLFGVPGKRLNEQVKRNATRFPADFMFQLTLEEFVSLRSQFATLKSGRGKHRKYLPYAFTENGAIMAATVLNTEQAVRMSVFVVRAFVRMREILSGTAELARQLNELESKLTSRLDVHETAIVEVLQRIMDILKPAPEPPEPPHKEIGFHIKEDGVPYRIDRVNGDRGESAELTATKHPSASAPLRLRRKR
jgi:phage regulator Rha-like protein